MTQHMPNDLPVPFPSCDDCFFALSVPARYPFDDADRDFLCRRHAPRPLIVMVRALGEDEVVRSEAVYPIAGLGCGEWRDAADPRRTITNLF